MQFAKFVVTRIIAYILVIWIGISVVFFVPRFMPSDPVESMLGRIMSQGAYMEAEQVEAMRATLTQAFGLEGTLADQYFGFLHRTFVTREFGPSLSMFPTPVNELIGRALPWTLGLLLSSTIIAWILGNAIGLLAGYKSRWLSSRALEVIAILVYPIPYYITALILIILFIHINPIFPLFFSVRGEALVLGIHFQRDLQLHPASAIDRHRRFRLVGLEHEGARVKHLGRRFVYFAKLKGAGEGRIMTAYVLRNAILPQVTVLALQIGAIFNGALIAEILFSYPGLGTMTYNAVLQADYNLLMGTITISIIAVATSTLIIDLLVPLL